MTDHPVTLDLTFIGYGRSVYVHDSKGRDAILVSVDADKPFLWPDARLLFADSLYPTSDRRFDLMAFLPFLDWSLATRARGTAPVGSVMTLLPVAEGGAR